MSSNLIAQLCRIAAPEKLTDRLLSSGVIRGNPSHPLREAPLLGYIFEVTKPWMPHSQLFETLETTLQTSYEQLTSKGNLDDQFELLLRNVNQALNQISEAGETDWIGNLNGLIIMIGDEEIHFSQTGRCPAFLLQNNRIRQITDDQAHDSDLHPLKTFSNLASGVIKEDDQLLISNQELYNEISLDALRRIMNTGTPFATASAIARELKREKNPRVATIVIALKTKTGAEEPELVSLEEALQSGIKRFQKRLTPLLEATRTHGSRLAKATGKAARELGEAAKKAAEQTAEKAKHRHATKSEEAIEAVAEISETPPVIEEIIPSSETEEIFTSTTLPDSEIGSIIPASEFAVEQPKPKRETKHRHGVELLKYFFLKKLPYLIMNGLHHAILWLQEPKNKKKAALGLAVIMVTLVAWGAYAQTRPKTITTSKTENGQIISDVADLAEKIKVAVRDEQTVEASRLVQSAIDKLQTIASPTDSQRGDIDTLWSTVLAASDSLTKTVRLSTATGTYKFKNEPSGFIGNLPYFYGWSTDKNELARTGIGDLANIQDSVSLTNATDSIISIAKSSEADTAGYTLTKHGLVYQISQIGTTTKLKQIEPASGEFAAGDLIGSYSGNVYILDSKSGLFWRYLNSGTIYSKGTNIIDVNKYDIKKTVSMAIDGAIYFLKPDGSVMKFNGSKQDDVFALKNQPILTQKLIKPIQIVANESTSSIFVLDAGVTGADRSTGKIVEFSKSGDYIRQYGFPENFTNVKAFDISPKEKKLWIQNGNSVSEFAI